MQHVTFTCGDIELEGRLNPVSPSRAAVLTHPHPLYGGDLHNSVVATMAAAFEDNNWSTLRFNFRGTGRSGGHFSEGRAEVDDVQAAIGHLTGLGFKRISLAGYSFGAWVLALWAHKHASGNHDLYLVCPPAAFIDFTEINRIAGLCLVITGERDELAPVEIIRPMLSVWQPACTFELIKGADHFFTYHSNELRQVLSRAVASQSDNPG